MVASLAGYPELPQVNQISRHQELSKSMAPCPPSTQQPQFVYNYGDPTDPIPSFEPQDVMGFTPLPLPLQDVFET